MCVERQLVTTLKAVGIGVQPPWWSLLHSPKRAFHVSRTVDHSVSGHSATGSAKWRIHQDGGRSYLWVEQIVNELCIYGVGLESKYLVEEHAAARAYLVAYHASADSTRPYRKAACPC